MVTLQRQVDLIDFFVAMCRCTRVEARMYLEAEEWDFDDAVISYRGDKAKKSA